MHMVCVSKCVCIHVCMCMCVSAHVRMHLWKLDNRVSAQSFFLSYVLNQELSLDLQLTSSARLAVSPRNSSNSTSKAQVDTTTPSFLLSHWGSNSRPYACPTSILPLKLLPQSWFSHFNWNIRYERLYRLPPHFPSQIIRQAKSNSSFQLTSQEASTQRPNVLLHPRKKKTDEHVRFQSEIDQTLITSGSGLVAWINSANKISERKVKVIGKTTLVFSHHKHFESKELNTNNW